MRQIRRRKWSNLLYLYIQGFPKNMGPQDKWEISVNMLFWTKESEAGIWDFKGKGDNSQVDEKEHTRG